MKQAKVNYDTSFDVLTGNGRSQAAVMVLEAGKSEGGENNRHRGSDQWLYVAAGTGLATINGDDYRLHPGSLLLIEHGDTHQITNDGAEPLQTLNFYVPPAYTDEEEELPAGKS